MPACHAGDRRFESGRVRHHSNATSRPVRPPGRGVSLPGALPRGIIGPVKRLPCSRPAAVLAVAVGRPPSAGVAVEPTAIGEPERRRPRVRATSAEWLPADDRPVDRARRSATASPSASLPPVDSPIADVPIVPVAQYRTTLEGSAETTSGRPSREPAAPWRPRARRDEADADPRRSRCGPPRRGRAPDPGEGRRDAVGGSRGPPQAPRRRSARMRSVRVSGPSAGAAAACSAWTQ